MEEQTLIEALKKHRRRALHQVIDTYTGYVTTVACRTAGGSVSHEDLEEIVSDVFLALWLHADTLDSTKPLRPYLAATPICCAPFSPATPPTPSPTSTTPCILSAIRITPFPWNARSPMSATCICSSGSMH